METLTFREVITNIKEGEVWESRTKLIECKENGLDIIRKNKIETNYMFFDYNENFKLQRKEYTFEEAFKVYEEGKELESVVTGISYKKDYEEEYDEAISINEIRGKWYIK